MPDSGPRLFPANQVAFTLLEQFNEQGIQRENDFDSDIQRLEHKMNLIIQLLGQMMASQQTRPAAVELKLGADFIAWYEPEATPSDEFIIELYLSEEIALPVQARVVVDELDNGWCQARFEGLSYEEQSAWERWVFRQHRRNIANKREHIQ